VKNLSGHTKPFAVLGHPIGHTLSPVMHNAAFAALGLDAIYLAFDVAPENLLPVLQSMRAMGFNGVNLTVPLKETAFRGLTDLAPSAKMLGAVNTVQFLPTGDSQQGLGGKVSDHSRPTEDREIGQIVGREWLSTRNLPAGLRGHNTDGIGFLRALQESFGLSAKGLSLFVLGCGGAGRAVAITAASEGAARLTLADVDDARCGRLADEIAALAPGASVVQAGGAPAAWPTLSREADLIVQASPVGMKPGDVCPLPPGAFRPGQSAFDLVYNLPETCFTKAAAAAGAKAVNGLGMLLHQGAEALSIWTGQPAPVDVMREALRKALYGK